MMKGTICIAEEGGLKKRENRFYTTAAAVWSHGLGRLLLLVALALLIEIFICNYSALTSKVYDTLDVTQSMRVQDERTLRAEGLNADVKNLFLDMELEDNSVVPVTISITDEGNAFAYVLPPVFLTEGERQTFYVNLHPFGKVHSISFGFPEGTEPLEMVRGVKLNAVRPVRIVWQRLAVLFAFLCLACCLRPGCCLQSYFYRRESRRQRLVTIGFLAAAAGISWQLIHLNPICIQAPWPHQKQYQELAVSLAGGKLYLDKEPSQGLLDAPNPYDTIYLQANGIPYEMDNAYYQGKYYVYFGIVPELIAYLPYYLLTGRPLPNYFAVFVFFIAFAAAVTALLGEIVDRWFPQTPYHIYLLLTALTVGCGNYLYIVARPDMYSVPIVAGNLFTTAGLWLWLRGKRLREQGERFGPCLGAGSLCMALVAGCRPQMLLFSVLALPLFWEELFAGWKLFSRIRGKVVWKSLLWLGMPYIPVAAGIMYYNAARFGSAFDFGSLYNLTSNDLSRRGVNWSRTLFGIYYYLFQPPIVTPNFPFLSGNAIECRYMGRMVPEFMYGGIISCNVLTWSLILTGSLKRRLAQKKIWGFTAGLLAVSGVLILVDVNGGGFMQRYTEDMAGGLLLASAIVMLMLLECSREQKKYAPAMKLLFLVCLFQAAFAYCVIFAGGDTGINVSLSDPTLYHTVESYFSF